MKTYISGLVAQMFIIALVLSFSALNVNGQKYEGYVKNELISTPANIVNVGLAFDTLSVVNVRPTRSSRIQVNTTIKTDAHIPAGIKRTILDSCNVAGAVNSAGVFILTNNIEQRFLNVGGQSIGYSFEYEILIPQSFINQPPTR